jgi:hypothetical protein
LDIAEVLSSEIQRAILFNILKNPGNDMFTDDMPFIVVLLFAINAATENAIAILWSP